MAKSSRRKKANRRRRKGTRFLKRVYCELAAVRKGVEGLHLIKREEIPDQGRHFKKIENGEDSLNRKIEELRGEIQKLRETMRGRR